MDIRIPLRIVSQNVKPYYFSEVLPRGRFEKQEPTEYYPTAKVIAEHRGWQLLYFRLDKTYYAVSEEGNWLYLGKYRNHTEAAAMFPAELHSKRGVER